MTIILPNNKETTTTVKMLELRVLLDLSLRYKSGLYRCNSNSNKQIAFTANALDYFNLWLSIVSFSLHILIHLKRSYSYIRYVHAWKSLYLFNFSNVTQLASSSHHWLLMESFPFHFQMESNPLVYVRIFGTIIS